METIKYEVLFMGEYPCGHRHPVKVVVNAVNAVFAIDVAADALEDDRIASSDHVLISVMPVSSSQSFPTDNASGELKPCPFCGSPNPTIMDSYIDGDTQYYVNCGCCNATQLPDSKERAIYDWNQRTLPGDK